MLTNEQVLKAMNQVMHPEMDHSLVELHMIKDVAIKDGNATITVAVPFKEIPIKDDLVHIVREKVATLDSTLAVEVRFEEMSQKERAAFMAMSNEGPKPAQPVNRVDHVIAVGSGKGGVGKSSVAALLAVALQRQGQRVGVLDADITGPSIPKLFGLHELPPVTEVGMLPAKTPNGIGVMSINLLLPQEDEAVIWRGPLISSAIKQFWEEVAWGHLDYLIVDLPPGTSDAALTVMQSIPLNGIVLVTSPQDLAGMVVRKAARMAQRMKVPVVGLVENMSYITCPKCGERIEVFGPSQAERTTAQLGLPLLGHLPLDPELARRCDAGEIEQYAAKLFKPIADKVRQQAPTTKTVPTM